MQLRNLLVVLLAGCPHRQGPGQPDPVDVPPASGSAEGGDNAPGMVGCDGASCRFGQEVCCRSGDKSVCGTMGGRHPAAGEEQEFWFEQAARCAAASRSEFSLTSMSACDDSKDCDSDEMCCGSAIGDIGLEVCAMFQNGDNACEYGELCAGDATCKTSGTRCIEGRCRKGPVAQCGKTACSDDAPLCCANFGGSERLCGTAASCKAKDYTAEYACAVPNDCPTGERCIASLGGTRCQGSFDVMNNTIVCTKDADCPVDVCNFVDRAGARPRCAGSAPGPAGDVKVCECS